MDNDELPRAHHDLGGVPKFLCEPVDVEPHALTDFDKEVDAIRQILGAKKVMSVDELRRGIEAIGVVLEGRGEHARRRQGVIASSPDLQERELIKLATMSAGLAAALRGRAVPEPTASLAAEAGIAVFRTAFVRWVEAPGSDFITLLHEGFDELAALAAPPRAGSSEAWAGPANL